MRFSNLFVALLASNTVAARRKHCSGKGHGHGHSLTKSVPHVSPTSTVTPTPTPTPTTEPGFTPSSPASTSSDVIEIPTSHSTEVAQPTSIETVTIVTTSSPPSTKASKPTTLRTVVSSSAVTTTKATSSAAPAPTSGPSNPGSPSVGTDEQGGLDAHNDARSEVGTADLVWDDELTKGAQEWADHLASIGKLEHAGAKGVGENLYMSSGSATFANAVKAFVSEKSKYTGQIIDSSNYMTFGHYTQVVWKSTTKVGMAKAKASNGNVYVVARYSPPGNFLGQKPY